MTRYWPKNVTGKDTWINQWEYFKKWSDFGDLDLVFKVNLVMYVYVKALAAPFLPNLWLGFDQTDTDTPLGGS